MPVLGGMSDCPTSKEGMPDLIWLFNYGIENSIGNESGSLKVVLWYSDTVDCLWKDMSELV